MALVYLSLGSNINPTMHITQGIELLRHVGRLEAISRWYTTPPWGGVPQDDFVNLCVRLRTDFTPQRLLRETQAIENICARVRDQKWGPRTLDIDILFYDDVVIDTPELVIPHPHIQQRAFVLLPLADIMSSADDAQLLPQPPCTMAQGLPDWQACRIMEIDGE